MIRRVCEWPGCEFLIAYTDGGWKHVDTHGADVEHKAFPQVDGEEDLVSEIRRMSDMNAALARQCDLLESQLDAARARGVLENTKRLRAEEALVSAERTTHLQSKRIGELAASNFGLRMRAKVAEKQLKKLLKLDRKARGVG